MKTKEMKKVVITGATSMLGLALIEECLANEVEVLAYVRINSKKSDLLPKSDLLHVEYVNTEQFAYLNPQERDYDVFYHFAWAYTDKQGRNDSEKQIKNIQTTLDAVKLAKQMGCKKFIGAGSQAEYGLLDLQKISPNSPANPIQPYGISKYAAGKLASEEAKKLGLDFAWVRIFSVYGKYDQPTTMISSTIQKLQNGEKPSFTPATQRWDYLYSSDAGNAFYLIGEKSTGNKVYCLGSGNARPLREYIEELRDIVEPGAELGIGDIPFGTGTVMNICADISELQKDTGWRPQTTFAEGIQKTFEFLSMING